MVKGACHCGAVNWEFDDPIESVTACNCTVCRRYGVLWAYGHENIDVRVSGDTKTYAPGEFLDFHFCGSCGCVTYWRSKEMSKEGKRIIAVNIRLADIDVVSNIKIRRFDGLESFKGLPDDGRCVVDFWP